MIGTEIKFYSGRGVGTEDRFFLRRVFQEFLDDMNSGNFVKFSKKLSDNLCVTGFTESVFGKRTFIEYLKSIGVGKQEVRFRFPMLKCDVKLGNYEVSGDFEGFVNGIIAYEGSLIFSLEKVDETFIISLIKFYPRMMMR
jgi:hypothetical protein